MFFFKIWIRFLGFSFKRLFNFQSPLLVDDDETLGRAAYSGHVNKHGVLKINIYKVNKNKDPISCDRLTLAPRKFFIALSTADAKRRDVTFYGFAEIIAKTLRNIRVDEHKLDAKGTLTRHNPFHAEVPLPTDKNEDYYMEIALRLKDYSKYVPY